MHFVKLPGGRFVNLDKIAHVTPRNANGRAAIYWAAGGEYIASTEIFNEADIAALAEVLERLAAMHESYLADEERHLHDR